MIDEEIGNAEVYVAQSRASWLETARELERDHHPGGLFWFSSHERDYVTDRPEVHEQREREVAGKFAVHSASAVLGDRHTCGSRSSTRLIEVVRKIAREPVDEVAGTGSRSTCLITPGAALSFWALRTGRKDYLPVARVEDAAAALALVIRQVLAGARRP